MAVGVELASSRTRLDVLDRVLDKGIMIDAWMRVALAGLDIIEMEARVVVASLDTYLARADALALTGLVSAPVSIEPQFRRTRGRIGRRPPTRPLAAWTLYD
jgi:gas vesicle structural protein